MARFADTDDPELFAGRERESRRPDVRVVARRRDGYTHEVEIDGGHTLVIDEPAERRAATTRAPPPPAPPPPALAACTAITCEMYAERKGWELGAVEVRGRGRARAELGRFEAITVTLRVPEPLDDEQREPAAA